MDKWINKLGYKYTYEDVYYSVIKRNELLTHATFQMNFKNMLSEESQTQKVIYILYDAISMKYPEQVNLETESRLVVAKGWEEEKMDSNCLMVMGSSFGVIKMFWNKTKMVVTHTVNILNAI